MMMLMVVVMMVMVVAYYNYYLRLHRIGRREAEDENQSKQNLFMPYFDASPGDLQSYIDLPAQTLHDAQIRA